MMKHLLELNSGRRGRVLMLLGLALLIFSLCKLYSMDSFAQYIAPAAPETAASADPGADAGDEDAADPADTTANTDPLTAQIKAWNEKRTEMGGTVPTGMAAVAFDTSVTTALEQNQMSTLVCVGEGWLDVHPHFLTDGWLFTQTDYEKGNRVAVLDEKLAFQLFPTDEPVGAQLQIGENWYTIIGVVRADTSAGDADPDTGRIYIPLNTAAADRIQAHYVLMECREGGDGEKRALQDVAADVMENDGSYWDTDKEVMRATMLVRLLLIAFALYLLAICLKIWNRRTVSLITGWNEEVRHRYFKTMAAKVVGLSCAQLLGYAALAAAAFGILRLLIAPMYVFTEWIPEVIVEWSKISQRLTELLRTAAQTARYQTRQIAAIRLYGALTRWGVICLLTGVVLFKVWPGKKTKRMKNED